MYQIKRRTKAVSSLEILAAVGLTLGLSSWALGQDCGAGDAVSAEPCLVDGATDTTNAGCNNDPVNFEAAVIGGSISGTVSTYVSSGACPGDITGPGGDGVPDGTVDTNDLLFIFANWGPGGGFGQADITGPGGDGIPDGTVDTNDLLFIFAEWGSCPVGGSSRDTDWYLITGAQLLAADTDGNGLVVLESSASSEAPVALFVIALGDPTCDTSTIIGDTGWAGPGCAEAGVPANALVDVAANPNGIAFWIGTGNPDGSAIYTGYPCGNRVNDYTLSFTISELHEACTFEGAPCNEVTMGIPGCNDPNCCDLVCTENDVYCCEVEWDAYCVDFAINFQGCAPGMGAPVKLATGADDSVDGYLALFVDGYGSEANFGPTSPQWVDEYNPVGFGLQAPGFTETTFLFTGATDRVVLSLHPDTLGTWSGSTMTATMLENPVASDVYGGDGINDTVVNHFSVTGALTLDVICTQSIQTLLAEGGNPIATWTLSYEIRNDAGGAATFEVLRWMDFDFMWDNSYLNDVVGTGTNAGAGCDLYVYQGDPGAPTAAVTLSCDHPGASYTGSKNYYDLDCGDANVIPYGWGTDPLNYWAPAHNGLPFGWANGCAGVGNNTDGESISIPDDGCLGLGADGSIGMSVNVVSLGSGATTTVTFLKTYGAITPNGVVCSK